MIGRFRLMRAWVAIGRGAAVDPWLTGSCRAGNDRVCPGAGRVSRKAGTPDFAADPVRNLRAKDEGSGRQPGDCLFGPRHGRGFVAGDAFGGDELHVGQADKGQNLLQIGRGEING